MYDKMKNVNATDQKFTFFIYRHSSQLKIITTKAC